MATRRYLVFLFALGALLSTSALVAPAVAQTIPRDIRLQILEAVVQVIPFDPSTGETAPWSGSGTIISPDGHILTNYHVIGDLATRSHYDWHAIMVTDPSFTDQPPQFAYWARYVASDPTHDLAILKIEEYADETPVPAGTIFPAVAVGDSNAMLPGDPIVIVGYPGISGSTVTFTSGTMSGWVGEDFDTGGKQWIKTDAKIAHGNSGGAAFDLQGNLVGVPTAGRTVQYDELDVEEQAYVRPISLAWAVIGPNVSTVLRAPGSRPQQVTGQVTGQATGQVTGQASQPAAQPSPGAAAGPPVATPPATPPGTPPSSTAGSGDAGAPSGEYGELSLGAPLSSRLAAATEEGFSYHGYQVAVPSGTARVVVAVDGRGNDVDLAVSNGAPITDYEVVEHLDVSEEPNPQYVVDLPQGVVYVDVLNLFEAPIDYTVVVTAEGPAPEPEPTLAPLAAPFRNAGVVGALAVGQTATGSLEGLDETAPFHTYWVDAPAGTAQIVIQLSADQDLDIAAKAGAEIDTYTDQGNWDWIDTSTSTGAELVIPNPSGRIYIDVFNALGAGVTGTYTLRVH